MADTPEKDDYEIGEEVTVNGLRYIVTNYFIHGMNKTLLLSAIPDGMTALDLGTKFHGAALLFRVFIEPSNLAKGSERPQ